MANNPNHHSTRQIIRSFEAKALKNRSYAIRLADYLTTYFGTISFLLFNLVVFVVWIVVNNGWIAGIAPFDVFPYTFLTMIVSLEAIFLTTIVLMSQNRQSFIQSLREELQLQVNLITERELTKALHLLKALHEHHKIKIKEDPELEAMLKDIDRSYIERRLEEQIRGEQPSFPSVVTQPIAKFTEAVEKKLSQEEDK